MAIKWYFVYDKATDYILGYEVCRDDQSDGYNVFTRPYKWYEYHPIDEKCKLDYVYNLAKSGGLTELKKENLIVAVADSSNDIKSNFVENPNYLNDKYASRGWQKLDFDNSKIATLQ